MRNIVIVGGGPAGMMAAISAKKNHTDAQVYLLERNHTLGMKLSLSGGGRCNLSVRVSPEQFIKDTVRNGKFLYSALQQFTLDDIEQFFTEAGLPFKEEDHHRLFPTTEKAEDVIAVLRQTLKELGVNIKYQQTVKQIDLQNKQVVTNQGSFVFDHLILACGGKSYPTTGSDGLGYQLALQTDHSVTKILPAEVSLVSNDAIIQSKELQGLSFPDVQIKIKKNNKYKDLVRHDVIFTHFGLSGPGALRTSSHINKQLQKGPVTLALDFLADVSNEQLAKEIKTNGLLSLAKTYGLPKRFLQFIEKQGGDPLMQIKRFPLTIYTTRSLQQAFVSDGGIKIKDIDPKTMQSKMHPNISFAGEMMDVHGYTGGYNISIAFITGYVAGYYA
ncbi:hypothetical protein A4S06_08040 [Erysipelotrichaceae bacterium MTC7]|nr:hypothetical protein A4S06_08040 [Erysipelotrichaceae bacterium MTC7]